MPHTYFGSEDLILVDSSIRIQPNGQKNATFVFRIRKDKLARVDFLRGDTYNDDQGNSIVLKEDASIEINADGFATITIAGVQSVGEKGGVDSRYVYSSNLVQVPYYVLTKYKVCDKSDPSSPSYNTLISKEQRVLSKISVIAEECVVTRLQNKDDKSLPAEPSDIDMYLPSGKPFKEHTIYPHESLSYLNPVDFYGNFNGTFPTITVYLSAVRRTEITPELHEVQATYSTVATIPTQSYSQTTPPVCI